MRSPPEVCCQRRLSGEPSNSTWATLGGRVAKMQIALARLGRPGSNHVAVRADIRGIPRVEPGVPSSEGRVPDRTKLQPEAWKNRVAPQRFRCGEDLRFGARGVNFRFF